MLLGHQRRRRARLHHSGVADLHRPRPGQTWDTVYMGFIDPDGRIRPGHEVFNEL